MTLRRSSRKLLRPFLSVEALETREVPATVQFSGGNLFVSNPTRVDGAGETNLVLLQDPTTGYIAVTDGGASQGKYRVTGSITITGTNRPDNISVFLDNSGGKGTLQGGLSITGGNGNDDIIVDGTIGTERILGNLAVDGGYGNDLVSVGGSGLTIRGSNNQVIGSYGSDTFTLGAAAVPTSVIGGALSVYSVQDVLFNNVNILGGQLIDQKLSPTNSFTELTKLNVTYTGVNTTLTLNAPSLTIRGGALGDTLTFDSTSVLGTTVITEGAGDNNLTLDATVNGNFSYTATDGDNNVTVNATANIQSTSLANGNLSLSLGHGTNTWSLDTGFMVDGNFNLTNGDGGLNATIGATVGGNLSVTAGTGVNTLILDGDIVNGGNATTTFTQFFYSFSGGGNLNTVRFDNDASLAINATVLIPAVPGAYNLDLIFLGDTGTSLAPSPFNHTVNLTGGTAVAPMASGSINILKNGDTVAVVNALLGAFTVTQIP